MTKLRFLSLLAILALSITTTFAHGDKKHVVGTLEKVSADSVTVKTSDGKSVEVKLVFRRVLQRLIVPLEMHGRVDARPEASSHNLGRLPALRRVGVITFRQTPSEEQWKERVGSMFYPH